MRVKQRGYILFSVLIFLQVFALLSISTLEQALTAAKLTRLQIQNDDLVLSAKAMLATLEQDLPALEFCQLQQCYCEDRKLHYTYTLKDLGDTPCTKLRGQEAHAHYYQIDLWVQNTAAHLRSVSVRAHDEIRSCADEVHFVNWGRQWWRVL